MPTVVNVRTSGYDIYIGRANSRWGFTRSFWANPYTTRPDGDTREEVIAKYRALVMSSPSAMSRLGELRGMRLGCWCKPLPCHGDVLVELFKEVFGDEEATA